MNDRGFYKYQNEELFYAPNFVINKYYELYIELYNTYVYPIDGWYFFESEVQAREKFNLEIIDEL